jgi:hypothetical protein
MATTKILFGEWLPDQPGVTGALTDAVNCYPVTNGYAPFPSEYELSDSAGSDLLVSFAGKYAGVTTLFAASATNLYKYAPGDRGLDPLTTSGYTTVEFWDTTQFGSTMIAANGSNKLQSFALGTGTHFNDLAAAAPTARYVTVVRDFVVAANVAGEESRVYWSDINDETNWTPSSTSQSDSQLIPDGGDITGLAGGEYGLVFLERAIYRMSYSGSPYFFQFDAISRSLGCIAPGSVAQFGGLTYFIADDGFYVCDGQTTKNIGEEKVNRWFFNDVSRSFIKTNTSSAVDPIKKLVIWCYKTQSGMNRLIVFNIALNKWSYCDTTADSVASILTPSVTLEDLDLYSASIDALTASLDDPQWVGNQLLFAGSQDQKIITFGGANKTASIATGDLDFGRSVVTLARPIVDNGSGSVAVASRELLSDDVTYGTAIAADSEGRCSLRSAGRYHRLQVIPSDSTWVTAIGVNVDVVSQGAR